MNILYTGLDGEMWWLSRELWWLNGALWCLKWRDGESKSRYVV